MLSSQMSNTSTGQCAQRRTLSSLTTTTVSQNDILDLQLRLLNLRKQVPQVDLRPLNVGTLHKVNNATEPAGQIVELPDGPYMPRWQSSLTVRSCGTSIPCRRPKLDGSRRRRRADQAVGCC